MIIITKINIKYKDKLEELITRWHQIEPCETPILNPNLLPFSQYLKLLKSLEENKFNPMDFYLVLDKGEIVGYLELRLAQNDFNTNYAGHIGYAVAPFYRHRGYGEQILKRGIQELKKKKISPIILTCDKDHDISKKMFKKMKAYYLKDSHIYGEVKSIYYL